MSDARVLAELMGWIHIIELDSGLAGFHSRNISHAPHPIPDYPNDLNAMREVWQVLQERGLWDRFLHEWDNYAGYDSDAMYYKRVHAFLNDLPGQVKAAIKVLEEAQG